MTEEQKPEQKPRAKAKAKPVVVETKTEDFVQPEAETQKKKPVATKEYEFLEALPNKQQAAPVTSVSEANPDTRITKAIEGDETEPQKVSADKAFDKETAVGAPAIDGKPDPIEPPAEVDQPEITGVSETTDVRVLGAIEEGETEPKPVESDDLFADGLDQEPNPGKVGGEPEKVDWQMPAASSEEPKKDKEESDEDEADNPTTTNPKLKRLKKYGA